MAATKNKKALERITTNISGVVRHDTMEGRDYIVAPMVMLTEGVHAGTQGPLYYPAEEIAKTPAVWNHKPIVVYHPKDEAGNGISACEPEVLSARKVGVIMNTRYKKGKLQAEAWLEVSRLEKVDSRIIEALESDTMMELSTGLFTDNEEVEGTWNDESYDAIARNFRPDHLALLPDQVGACSIADGAGFLRLNEAAKDIPAYLKAAVEDFAKSDLDGLLANVKSYGNITSDLYGLVEKKYGDKVWLADVYNDFFIMQNGGKLYRVGYELVENKVVLETGAPTEVLRVTEYRTTDGAFVGNAGKPKQTREIPVMDKKQVVDGLIANAQAQWAEDDRAFLMGLTEAQLTKIAPAELTSNVETKPVPETKPAPVTAPVENTAQPKQLGWNEIVANADAPTQQMLKTMRANYESQKAEVIAKITANALNKFTPQQLAAKDLEELSAIAAFAAPPAPAGGYAPNYAGASTPAGGMVDNEAEEPLVMPRMTFA